MGGKSSTSTSSVQIPPQYKAAVPDFIAKLETLPVDVDTAARVVINERTGTVVIGGAVRLGPAAVAHGNLSVQITTRLDASQPGPLSPQGQTVVVPNEKVQVSEMSAQLMQFQESTTLDDVVRGLKIGRAHV